MDVIKYIFSFDQHFVIRNGEIVSIIPKSDYRFNLLKFITFKCCGEIEHFHGKTRYNYCFHNLHDYSKRYINSDDLFQVAINEKEDKVEYEIWIGRQKIKSSETWKDQMYFINNPKKYY